NLIADVMEATKSEELPSDKTARKPYLADFTKRAHKDPKLAKMRKEVRALCKRFPIPNSFV
ncbi:MAG TPA: hypothetical protein VJG64_04065, partial [Candidatus Paceibacterota bacterium]